MKAFIKGIAFAVVLAAGTSSYAASPTDGTNNNVSLKHLMQRRKTLEPITEQAADHLALVAAYHHLAQLQREESAKMEERAAWYARSPIYSSEKFRRSTIDTSMFFARKYRADAQKSDDLAARHERLAS